MTIESRESLARYLDLITFYLQQVEKEQNKVLARLEEAESEVQRLRDELEKRRAGSVWPPVGSTRLSGWTWPPRGGTWPPDGASQR